ncbi:sulfatase-like hydrolase/transferase [Reichenbachiella sp. MALMAid0571]|uniref:sulfatase-like hydrolase/transferase n=1 Tax=Reichenbachiella sp. MALMAid0571 TaxID=3143939 RepID=UPI0032E040C3
MKNLTAKRVMILVVILSLFGCSYEKKVKLPKKTNFIQILTDDQGWGDLGSFGHQYIHSPNVDQLAKDGIKFTHCYSSASVCSPARASIMTGRTPYRTGVYRWVPANHEIHLPASEITLPQLLQKAGYQTAHFGKWHLSHYSEERADGEEQYKNYGYGEDPDQPSMEDYGYDYWFATGNVARPSHKKPQNFFLNGKAMGTIEGFSAQIVADQVVDWMDNHREEDKPFFMTLWLHEPHGPIETDSVFMTHYDELKDESLKQYLGNVTQLDAAVGSVIQALEKIGETDNTLVWFTSDNGPEGPHPYGWFNLDDKTFGGSRFRGSTGGLRGRKRHSHEGGIRVPGIIKWPEGLKLYGVKSGSVSAEPIIGADVFPTFLDIAGVSLPENRVIDGSSILPVLQGQPFNRERPLYWRNNFNEMKIALRIGDWKILGNSMRENFELYNLIIDPRETTDLSAHEPERFETMKRELIAYDKEVLAEGRPDWYPEKMKSKLPLEVNQGQ